MRRILRPSSANFWLGEIRSQKNPQKNKGNAKRGVSLHLKIWPCDLNLWPWKSVGFQILLRTKYVPSLVKIHWRMLILECSQGCYGRTDGSVTISLCNFVGEGIKKDHKGLRFRSYTLPEALSSRNLKKLEAPKSL